MSWKPIKNPKNDNMKQWEYNDNPGLGNARSGPVPSTMVGGRTTKEHNGKTIDSFFQIRKKIA